MFSTQAQVSKSVQKIQVIFGLNDIYLVSRCNYSSTLWLNILLVINVFNIAALNI